ncbi:hypothetical protein O181_067167 [Austropuccinia psidii MF-1]|uniref:Uncharacterized protein n=1 Tax=Austropuccinia psidii MF-1 TaxID=1389203 RepID=A0A9Q3EWU2_9BASI|nr:hypothetical protein [Austropuccinia psidii MF-1]
MGFKRQSKSPFSSLTHFSLCNHTEFLPLHIEQIQLNALQQGSPVPSLPRKPNPSQPTPGLSGTQWSEDLFFRKEQKIVLLISTFESSELTVLPFLEPSQPNEPPIPGLSKPSEPHEEDPTCEPEPELAPMQSAGKSPLYFFYSSQLLLTHPLPTSSLSRYTPSVIMINNTPIRSPPPIPPIPVPSPFIPG